MHRLLGSLALGLLVLVPIARADQCEVVDARIASRAVAAIRASHGRLLVHCEPCGDPRPTLAAAFVPREVRATDTQVIVDGRPVDLAYLYLEVRSGWFENVALRTGCEAFDVAGSWVFGATGLRRSRGFGPVPPALRALGWGYTDAVPRPRLPAPG